MFLQCFDTVGWVISINQYIYNAPWYRGACYSADYVEAKRNVLSRVLNAITDGAVRQFRGSEFQSLGAATEKRRAAVSKLCGGTDRNVAVSIVSFHNTCAKNI